MGGTIACVLENNMQSFHRGKSIYPVSAKLIKQQKAVE